MMTATVREATASYDAIHAQFVRASQRARQNNSPMLSIVLRNLAVLVARASLAEVLDPQPIDLEKETQ